MKITTAHERELYINKIQTELLNAAGREVIAASTNATASAMTSLGKAMKASATTMKDFAQELEKHKAQMELEKLERINKAFLESKRHATSYYLDETTDGEDIFESVQYVDKYGNLTTKISKRTKPNDEERPVKTAKPLTPLDDIDQW